MQEELIICKHLLHINIGIGLKESMLLEISEKLLRMRFSVKIDVVAFV